MIIHISYLGTGEGVDCGLHACKVPLAQRRARQYVAADAPHVLARAGAAARAARGRGGARARAPVTAMRHILHRNFGKPFR